MLKQELAAAQSLDESYPLSAQKIFVVALKSRVRLHCEDEDYVAGNGPRQLIRLTTEDNFLAMFHTLNTDDFRNQMKEQRIKALFPKKVQPSQCCTPKCGAPVSS